MAPEQRSLAHPLLQCTLLRQGYPKTSGIIHLDEILKSLAEKRRPNNTLMLGHDLYRIGIIGEPLFSDPSAGDFSFRTGSPALKLGIEPLDVSQMGRKENDLGKGNSAAFQDN